VIAAETAVPSVHRETDRFDGVVTPASLTHVSASGNAMGGRLAVHVAVSAGRAVEAERAARATMSHVRAWAARLTRFDAASDLSRLNADPHHAVAVRPTLAAALAWGAEATRMTGGIVDVTLLDARIAAERGDPGADPGTTGPWTVARQAADREPAGTCDARPGAGSRLRAVTRAPGIRFDLDGVGKGWLADRALAALATFPGAIVDADGDVAIRVAPGDAWFVAIEDPRSPGMDLAVVRLTARDMPEYFGLATSGVSIHRWEADPVTPAGSMPASGSVPASALAPRHHLIDPRTRRPAVTDVVQATVLAGSAREAEALAKAAVILGTLEGFALLEAAGVAGAVLLTERGESIAMPRTLRWLE
jgi:thiamine biosynthesis lipoprotein